MHYYWQLRKSFRPHEGGHPFYSDKLKFAGEQGGVSVPTKGTHLLYHRRAVAEQGYGLEFPSPRRGPIFSTFYTAHVESVKVCFRPHEGDPSSLLCSPFSCSPGTYSFPSPRRGPIFSTMYVTPKGKETFVSVPTKGTHLLYKEVLNYESTIGKFPSPRRGPIFSTLLCLLG